MIEIKDLPFSVRDEVTKAIIDPTPYIGPKISFPNQGMFEQHEHWQARAAIHVLVTKLNEREAKHADRDRRTKLKRRQEDLSTYGMIAAIIATFGIVFIQWDKPGHTYLVIPFVILLGCATFVVLYANSFSLRK